MRSCIVVPAAAIFLLVLFWPPEAVEAATFKEQVLYSFCTEKHCYDGANPEAGVTQWNGLLYGMTFGGGRGKACPYPGCGTVFSLNPATGAEKVIHSFCRDLDCPDGAYPDRAGVIAVRGMLYGGTFQGGGTGCFGNGCGVVFSLNPATGRVTVLHDFQGNDGAAPQGNLIAVKGKLYGVTQSGGVGGMGTVFALDIKTDAEKVVYSFCTQQSCADGFNPNGVIDVSGTLYGTTIQGGIYKCDQGEGCGTVFSLNPKTGAETVLHSFGNGSDGWNPYAPPIAIDGTLYGTTGGGGNTGCSGGCGTVYSIDPTTGAEKVIYAFCSQQNCADGANPSAALVEMNGALFGTTEAGGSSCNCGTVFSIDPATGAEKVLYSFHGSDGFDPMGNLVEVDGTLFGTTDEGGSSGYGTVFSLAKTNGAAR